MKKNLMILAVVIVLVLSVFASSLAYPDFDPRKAFAKSDAFDYNERTGEWGWNTCYTPYDHELNYFICVEMMGNEDEFYAPYISFSIEKVGSYKSVMPVDSVIIRTNNVSYELPYLDTARDGSQYVIVGPNAMRLIENMGRYGFSYTFRTSYGDVNLTPDKQDYDYKWMKKELTLLTTTKWWNSFYQEDLDEVDRMYPLYPIH